VRTGHCVAIYYLLPGLVVFVALMAVAWFLLTVLMTAGLAGLTAWGRRIARVRSSPEEDQEPDLDDEVDYYEEEDDQYDDDDEAEFEELVDSATRRRAVVGFVVLASVAVVGALILLLDAAFEMWEPEG
jgi:hypothetical protein